MTTQLITDPVLDDASPGNSLVAHIIRKDDQMRGYVHGEEITALCGTRFIPTRDPKNFPDCEGCKMELRNLFK